MNKTAINRSQQIYDLLLNFYPNSYRKEFGEEMKYVFSESLKDSYSQSGDYGIVSLWTRTIIDVGKSVLTQHVEALKGGGFMKQKNGDILMQNKIFLLGALATGLILLVPFLAMQFNVSVPDPGSYTQNGINWTLSDFIVMGTLIFGTGSIFVLVARKYRERSQRIIIGVVLSVLFFWIWIELAVGLFTNIGS